MEEFGADFAVSRDPETVSGKISAEFAAETAIILRRRSWDGDRQSDWLATQRLSNRSPLKNLVLSVSSDRGCAFYRTFET